MLTLQAVNQEVFSVHRPDGSHVGNLKHIGAVWKFKAVGYDADGSVIPGGGPCTDQHNTQCKAADAQELSCALGEHTQASTQPLFSGDTATKYKA